MRDNDSPKTTLEASQEAMIRIQSLDRIDRPPMESRFALHSRLSFVRWLSLVSLSCYERENCIGARVPEQRFAHPRSPSSVNAASVSCPGLHLCGDPALGRIPR
jgi:hypothetical protein